MSVNEQDMTNVLYQGPERREEPQAIYVEPTSAWWSKVTLPFLFTVIVQFGVGIWWAANLSAKVDGLQEDFERHASFNQSRHDNVMALIQEIRNEIKEDRALFIEHMRDPAHYWQQGNSP